MRDESKEAWLNSQKEKTRGYYRGWFAYFEQFAKMTSDDILERVKVDKAGTWEAKIIEFKEWSKTQRKLSDYTVTAMAMAVRSFFSYHRVPLQFRTGEKKRLNERSRLTEDYYFSLADLKQLNDLADLEERYILVAGKSFGLRAGDFLKLTRGDLEPHINDEAPISIGRRETVKEKVPAYPFIDSDAQEVIKTILAKIAVDGRTKPTDRILLFKQEIDLTRALKRLVKRSGLNVGNKRVRFHCLRKFLCDHLSSHMSESKWKQIVGKKISEGAYIGVESLREDYKRVMIETCFNKQLDDRARQAAKEEFEKIFTSDQRDYIARHGGMRFNLKKAEKKTCKDGEHCGENFKQVQESDLLDYLKEGWEIAYKLSDGEVIVKSG